jgi:hypothetical protein
MKRGDKKFPLADAGTPLKWHFIAKVRGEIGVHFRTRATSKFEFFSDAILGTFLVRLCEQWFARLLPQGRTIHRSAVQSHP